MNPTHKEPGKLGMLDCIMLLIGVMIGSAIFSLSGLTILTAGPAAVLSWVIAGVIMLCYGICMAELACRYPKSGGVYYFPRCAFGGKTGRCLGWCSAWCFILTNIVAVAFSGIYVGIYLSVAFPWAGTLQLPLALGAIGFCLVMNLLRLDVAGKLNAVLVGVLLATMALYAASSFGSGKYETQLLTPFFTQGTGGTYGFLAAIPIALIGYSGIIALAFMASEVRNTHRTIPAAMFIAILFVVLVYALMIVATLGLVSAGYLKENPDMRFIPMFAACFTKLSGIPNLSMAVSIAAVLALLTTMNVCISINARALEAVGADGILPLVFSRRTPQNVPGIAAAVTCFLAMIYCFFPKYTQEIVNFGAVLNILTMVISLVSLISSRRRFPECGFVAPGGRLLPVFVLTILLLANAAGIVTQGWKLWGYTAGFLALGGVIYFISERRRRE